MGHHIEALQFSSEPLQCSFVLQISVSTANLWNVVYSWMTPTYSVVAFSLSMAFCKAWWFTERTSSVHCRQEGSLLALGSNQCSRFSFCTRIPEATNHIP